MSFGRPYIMAIDGCIHDGWLAIRDSQKNFDLKFLCILLGTDNMLSQYKAMAAGSTVNNLNKDLVGGTTVSYPSMDEQIKIGEYYEGIDNLITLQQRKYLCIVSHTEIRYLLPILYAFTNGWEQRKLSNVAEIIGGRTPSTTNSEYWDGDINWYAPAEIGEQIYVYESQRKITKLGLEKSSARILPAGRTVLFTSRAGIGKTAILRNPACTNQGFQSMVLNDNTNPYFVYSMTDMVKEKAERVASGSTFAEISGKMLGNLEFMFPSKPEQDKIGAYFESIDNLITLQQCKPQFHEKEVFKYMLSSFNSLDLFWAYYETWIRVYKEGAIRKPTMDKYLLTLAWLKNLAPNLKLKDVTRISYQKLLNDYAIYHERQTTLDFHHQLKGAVLDAVDDGLIDRDPTRKAIIKGKTPRIKKTKYLNQFELHKLLSDLDLGPLINWDWLILLIAKTGMRFSEALAVTPADFDFSHQMLTIDKTWDYKGKTGFAQTKNKSSVRKIQIDWQLIIQFSELTKNLPPEEPIFIKGNVYNSTINDILSRHCKNMDIPVISVHGLRHTHASLLLFAGVSIASVAQRLGHSSMTTTQKTYLHIIRELENRDVDLVMRSLSSLN